MQHTNLYHCNRLLKAHTCVHTSTRALAHTHAYAHALACAVLAPMHLTLMIS